MKKIWILIGICLSSLCCVFTSCTSLEDDGYAHDVAFLGPEHIVVAKWNGGVAISKNGGSTWESSNTRGVPILELTIGANGRIWGLYRWHGIHESSSAKIVYSDHGGVIWNSIKLSPSVCMPEAFVSPYGIEPLLVAYNGQLWQHTSGTKETWDRWKKLGLPNPDQKGITGIATKNGIYVSSGKNIWLSVDKGNTWDGMLLEDIRAFCTNNQFCWAITGEGTLYRTDCGTNSWKQITKVPGVDIAFRLAVKDGNVYVAAEGSGWKAFGPIVKTDSTVQNMSGLEGKQGYSVRISPDGKAWFVAQGLYVEDKGRWKKVWP